MARLWWPVGYGDQPLSPVTVTLLDGGDELDRWTSRIGFRTIELCTDDDEIGTEFTLKVPAVDVNAAQLPEVTTHSYW